MQKYITEVGVGGCNRCGADDDWYCRCGPLTGQTIGNGSHVAIPASEFLSLNRRVGFLEGFLGNLEMLSDEELRPAIERGIKRYQEIQAG